jgi:hypothetical protein
MATQQIKKIILTPQSEPVSNSCVAKPKLLTGYYLTGDIKNE